ncbi:MAG: hypothetical protein AB8B56_14480 [Crocinitomicaceae bacterium]
MKSNTKTWLLLLVLLPLISGVYGIIHDQITYTISSDYFTHFKFIQFNIAEGLQEYERLAAALVGFLSTWWVGILLALPLGIIGYKKLDVELYKKSRIKSIKTIFLVAIVFGVIGYIAGLIFVSNMSDWPMNIGGRGIALSEINDWDHFLIVGTIHNFSYVGALIGLIIALVQQFRLAKSN